MPNQYTGRRALETVVCSFCGKTRQVWRSRAKQGRLHFCSRICHANWKFAQAVASIREPLATRMPNGCLIYNGHKNSRGYGRLTARGRHRPAHTFSWEVANGRPMPKGYHGCHNCPDGDNPSCVEPSHIWPGTDADNNADKAQKGRAIMGGRSRGSKLTDQDVVSIRSRYSQNLTTQQMLADEYGVSQVLIGMVVRRKIWRHVCP
jgi:hypothetical protein